MKNFGKKDSFSDAEISALALNLLTNYRKTNSAIKSLDLVLGGDLKYGKFAQIVSRHRLSSTSCIKKEHFVGGNLNILLNILDIGIRNGTDISKNLEDFLEWIDAKIENENKIRSKVNGMQVLSLIGIAFFFPLFSGITASIVRSSLSGPSANTTVTGLRLIGIGYVFLVALITNSFLNPSRKLLSAVQASIPIAAIGFLLQTAAFTFSSYAL